MPDRDLTHLENLDAVDRKRWSIAASEALIQSQTREVLVAIAARGLDEFIRVSRPIYAGHAFRFEDFKRMYERICRASRRRAPQRRQGRRVH